MSSTMVGSADEPDQECVTRLPLLSFPVHSRVDHDDNSGCSTPPFQVSVSVPFKWEEEPGKPIPCTDLIHFTEPISLKLIPPPRMAWVDPKVTKTPSPTTVLDGPCVRRQLGPMIMSNNREKMVKKKVGRRLFGSWSWRSNKSKRSGGEMGKREGLGGSFVYSSSSAATSFDDGMDCCSEYGGESECVVGGDQVKMSKIKKSKSFLSLARVMPWKVKKDRGASTCEKGTVWSM